MEAPSRHYHSETGASNAILRFSGRVEGINDSKPRSQEWLRHSLCNSIAA
jgi:hypothetical protein